MFFLFTMIINIRSIKTMLSNIYNTNNIIVFTQHIMIITIAVLNIYSLFPYRYSLTIINYTINMSVAIIILIIYYLFIKISDFIKHIILKDMSIIISMIIITIEVLSLIIRPITLSTRLSFNIL